MNSKKVLHTCLNCGNKFHGDYCPACGQAANTGRFTFSSTLHNLVYTLTGSENTFLSTAGQLFYRPGHLVRDFICGRRARYFRPVQMLLFLVTIYVLVSYFIDDNISPIDIFRDSSFDSNVNSSSLASAIVYIGAFLSNKVTFSLVAAILFTMPFHLVFKRCRIDRIDGSAEPLNTAEHFYTLIYVCCQTLITYILMLPLGMLEGIKQLLMSFTAHLRRLDILPVIQRPFHSQCTADPCGCDDGSALHVYAAHHHLWPILRLRRSQLIALC